MTIEDQLRRDEGEVLHVYLDPLGIRTGGVGHNLEAHGIDWPVGTPITKAQSDEWLAQDLNDVANEIGAHLPWATTLSGAIYGVLQNMWFNMGQKVLGFKKMLAAIQKGDYRGAADDMAQSLWAKEVGPRAKRLEKQMATAEWV